MRAIIRRKEHLYRIVYYVDHNGKSEFEDYLKELNRRSKKSKDARVKFNTIHRYISYLEKYGTQSLPHEYVKHIKDDIWELIPDELRILYFYFKNDTFVLLHHFVKKTRKTPKNEIEKAIKEREDHVKRNG